MDYKKVVKLLSFVVIILVVILFVLVSYILTIDSHVDMNEPIPTVTSDIPSIEPTPTEEEEVVIEDRELIKKLTSKTIDNLYVLPFMTSGKTKDFADWKKIILTISKYENEIATPLQDCPDSEIKAEDLKEKMKELFGSKITYQDRSYHSFSHKLFPFTTDVYYLNDTNIYRLANSGAGHGLSIRYYSIPFKLTKKGDIFQLRVYRVFRPIDEMFLNISPTFYSDYEFENKILDLTGSIYEEEIESLEGAHSYSITEEELSEELSKNKDNPNLVIDTYSFEQEGDNYIWVEYETTAKN